MVQLPSHSHKEVVVASLSDYSVAWYRGTYTAAPGTSDDDFIADENDFDNANSGSINAGSALVNGEILSLDGLEAGFCTVFIIKDNASGTRNEGCSALLTINIVDDCD